MATFRCKRSGNTVSFTSANDIAGLRKHTGYEEVIEDTQPAPVDETPSFLQPVGQQPYKGRQKKGGYTSN